MAQSSTMEYEMEQKAEDRRFKKADRLAVKIVSIVANKVDCCGELAAYDGIEAARQIRNLLIKSYS